MMSKRATRFIAGAMMAIAASAAVTAVVWLVLDFVFSLGRAYQAILHGL